ncbi:MAG: hypothetical protein GXO02_04790, partial [Epsilonproteobacteria bacterium]|nr:hypothetical protein [Campylobacterota bacterium]
KDSDLNEDGSSNKVEIKDSNNTTLDGGIYKPKPPIKEICLGDFVWEDINGNGVQDNNEPPLANVGVSLKIKENGNWVDAKDVNGNKIEKIETNSSGEYKFCHLSANKDYKVIFDRPIKNNQKYYPTHQDRGSDEKDSDINKELEIIVNAPKESNLTLDAGFFRAAKIGDYIWEDANANGVQDEDEKGIKGVKVILIPLEDKYGNKNEKDLNGNPLGEDNPIFTNENGEYLFNNLVPGKYQVKVEVEDYYVTREDVNITSDDKDSDLKSFLDTNTLAPMPVEVLISAESNLTLDGGLFKSACIKRKLFIDRNGNGVYDEGDEPLEGVKVTLIPLEDEYGNKNEIDVTKEPLNTTTITNSEGDYEFCGLIPGNYKVEITPTKETEKKVKEFVLLGGKKSEVVNLTSGEEDTLTEYVQKASIICIGDMVWYDENANGIQDEGSDYGVRNVKVSLYMKDSDGKWVEAIDVDGVPIFSTTTDKNGRYKFCNLDKDLEYKIAFELPEGYHTTIANQGSDDKDSDANEKGEIIIPKGALENLPQEDGIGVDFSRDMGIVCDCEDSTGTHRELKVSAFNSASGLALILIFSLLGIFRQRKEEI